jgi:hypothetical protein
LQVAGDELILLDEQQKEICRHLLCRLKGEKILSTDHGRDKQAAIAQMMDSFSDMMENKLQALNWLSQIKANKPRYIRDQIQLLKATVSGLDAHIASQALNYVCAHQIVSASDFKAVVEALKREQAQQCLPELKVIQLNPLSGESSKNAAMVPHQSELATYDTYFSNQ